MRRLSVSARCALMSLVVVLLLGLCLAALVGNVVRGQATAEATRSGETLAAFISCGLAPGAVNRRR